jgi:hypothetical protein
VDDLLSLWERIEVRVMIEKPSPLASPRARGNMIELGYSLLMITVSWRR